MSRTRAAAWIAGGGLLAAWLAAAAGAPITAVPAAPAPARATEVYESAAVELLTQARELRSRLEGRPLLRPSSRNPFKFAAKRPAALARSPVPSATPQAPVVSRPLTLAGIAVNETPGGTVRTAIISGGGQLFLVGEGDPVASCCRVSRIGADAVEVRDEVTGATIRLGFR